MVERDIDNAQVTDYDSSVADVTISQEVTDGATGSGETRYTNPDWSKWWGFFNASPDLKSAMLMKAIWVVGKGYTTENDKTKTDLDLINGWGKDTFDDILFNMEVIKRVGGDSFAEIVRDGTTLLNLKVLDPSIMAIIVGPDGIIKRYEQTSKVKGEKPKKFEPSQIFHLSNNRLADQIHGISDVEVMEKTLLAENESFEDMKKIMHRQARGFIIFKLKTDDPVKVDGIVTKIQNVRNKGDDIFIPDDEDIISAEVVQVNVSQVVLAWRDDIRNRFYRALGLPQIIFGSAGSTESGGKIEYTAHEQVFEKDQRALEKQIWAQLAIKIDLVSPVTLLQGLQADESKDANQGLEIQPQDVSTPSLETKPPTVPTGAA